MRVKGGAALKRPHVKLFHMAPKADDHDLVKAVFGLNNINLEVWLKTLDKEILKTTEKTTSKNTTSKNKTLKLFPGDSEEVCKLPDHQQAQGGDSAEHCREHQGD